MSGPKKRKVDVECRVFNNEWTTKYFFTEVRSTAVCLICQEAVAVFKEYNISRHFTTKHADYCKEARQLSYRLGSISFTDKLQFKKQVPRQVSCWHSSW
ncbi:unnamed protein product [Knipowitschia caucasica]